MRGDILGYRGNVFRLVHGLFCKRHILPTYYDANKINYVHKEF